MKKLFMLLILMLFPFSVLAYSEYIIPGGATLGIEVNSKGILVVGFYKIDGKLINQDLRVGDKITKVNGVEVNSSNELSKLIDKYMVNEEVQITYERDNEEYNMMLKLSLQKDSYRTGLYIKSSVLGIGTLSYIDPETGVYGILGHALNISSTNKEIDIKDGNSYNADVTSFTRSVDGNPGSKNANIHKDELFGTIEHNSSYGLFGKIKGNANANLLKVGRIDEVSLGKAYIYTTDLNNDVKEYEIKILEVDKQNREKNIYFEIVDKNLLEMSGGIVQGMSGSPIIQNDKIIGAVTRVLVDDVTKGYGISIVTMLEEGDRLASK